MRTAHIFLALIFLLIFSTFVIAGDTTVVGQKISSLIRAGRPDDAVRLACDEIRNGLDADRYEFTSVVGALKKLPTTLVDSEQLKELGKLLGQIRDDGIRVRVFQELCYRKIRETMEARDSYYASKKAENGLSGVFLKKFLSLKSEADNVVKEYILLLVYSYEPIVKAYYTNAFMLTLIQFCLLRGQETEGPFDGDPLGLINLANSLVEKTLKVDEVFGLKLESFFKQQIEKTDPILQMYIRAIMQQH